MWVAWLPLAAGRPSPLGDKRDSPPSLAPLFLGPSDECALECPYTEPSVLLLVRLGQAGGPRWLAPHWLLWVQGRTRGPVRNADQCLGTSEVRWGRDFLNSHQTQPWQRVATEGQSRPVCPCPALE